MARVMVVDDEVGVRHVVRLAIEQLGLPVCEASEAEEALKLAEVCRPDLVVTDLRLPGRSGRDLAAELHQIDPAIMVVLISASPDAGLAAENGAIQTVLTKPFKLKDLTDRVQELIQNRGACRPMS